MSRTHLLAGAKSGVELCDLRNKLVREFEEKNKLWYEDIEHMKLEYFDELRNLKDYGDHKEYNYQGFIKELKSSFELYNKELLKTISEEEKIRLEIDYFRFVNEVLLNTTRVRDENPKANLDGRLPFSEDPINERVDELEKRLNEMKRSKEQLKNKEEKVKKQKKEKKEEWEKERIKEQQEKERIGKEILKTIELISKQDKFEDFDANFRNLIGQLSAIGSVGEGDYDFMGEEIVKRELYEEKELKEFCSWLEQELLDTGIVSASSEAHPRIAELTNSIYENMEKRHIAEIAFDLIDLGESTLDLKFERLQKLGRSIEKNKAYFDDAVLLGLNKAIEIKMNEIKPPKERTSLDKLGETTKPNEKKTSFFKPLGLFRSEKNKK